MTPRPGKFNTIPEKFKVPGAYSPHSTLEPFRMGLPMGKHPFSKAFPPTPRRSFGTYGAVPGSGSGLRVT